MFEPRFIELKKLIGYSRAFLFEKAFLFVTKYSFHAQLNYLLTKPCRNLH